MKLVGLLISVFGSATFFAASSLMCLDWRGNYDFGWTGWFLGAGLLGLGLDLLSGHRYRKPQKAWLWLIPILMIAATYRFGKLPVFPGEGYASQIEAVQAGNFGAMFLGGFRGRWEHTLTTLTAASGLFFVGYTQFGLHCAFSLVSVLKFIPLYGWLLNTVGFAGAILATATMATSRWDVIASFVGHADMILIPCGFWALAIIRRRQHWLAYACAGFVAGLSLSVYVMYRTLSVLLLLCCVWLSFSDRKSRILTRLARSLITTIIILSMAIPLFVSGIKLDNVYREYLDGWHRAKGQEYWVVPKTLEERKQASLRRISLINGMFWYGDDSPTRSVKPRAPLVAKPVTWIAAIGLLVCMVRFRNPVLMTLRIGFAITLIGGLFLTGNFDPGRATAFLPYFYALVGVGFSGMLFFVRGKYRFTVALLSILVIAGHSAYTDTEYLLRYWNDIEVKRASRVNIAYFTSWLSRNVKIGERVVVLASGQGSNILSGNDATWMFGKSKPDGVVVYDPAEVPAQLCPKPGPVLLTIFEGHDTKQKQEKVEAATGIKMEFIPDPLDDPALGIYKGGDVAYAHWVCA